MRKKALCYFAVKLNAITMKKALFISLCVLLLAGTGCKKNAEPEPHNLCNGIISGYYETVCTFRVESANALGDVYIYGGSFGKLIDNQS